jgi:Tfp pilus assembly protein PilO
MEGQRMNAEILGHHLRYRLAQLGTMGTLGIALILAALFMWRFVVQPEEIERLQLDQRVHQPRVEVKTQSQLDAQAKLNTEEQLRLFYANFPTEEQIPELLSGIFAAATKQGLILESGEYVAPPITPGGSFAEYRITLPVKGRFTDVMAFIDEALGKGLTVALEGASFKRPKIDDPQIEAKLVFVVFLKGKI